MLKRTCCNVDDSHNLMREMNLLRTSNSILTLCVHLVCRSGRVDKHPQQGPLSTDHQRSIPGTAIYQILNCFPPTPTTCRDNITGHPQSNGFSMDYPLLFKIKHKKNTKMNQNNTKNNQTGEESHPDCKLSWRWKALEEDDKNDHYLFPRRTERTGIRLDE